MHNPVGLERCSSFVNLQIKPVGGPIATRPPQHRAVTLSRQAGCGARVVAEKLAARLQAKMPAGDPSWTVLDRNLMETVLADHHLPARIAKFLPEDRVSELQDIMEELFGLRPASWTMIEQTSETMLKLAERGNVILIGRGGNVITAKCPNVVHVRLVAPLETRIEQATRSYGMSPSAARAFCLHEDAGRRRYLRKYFHADIDDPLLYHLWINTGLVSFDEAARLIAEAVTGQGISAAGGSPKVGIPDVEAACAHRAELQYVQLERL